MTRPAIRTAWTAGALLLLIGRLCAPAGGMTIIEVSAAINTWLVLGTFENDAANSGFERDWIGEATVVPREGVAVAGREWRYFDDRLFSRNYDNYQDLFSYFRVKRNESVAAKVVYAHVYVHSTQDAAAELRIGADNEFKAWVNGEPAASSTKPAPRRDSVRASIRFRQGWNRLLLKIANQADGRLGFYARVEITHPHDIRTLTFSVNGDVGPLAISTKPMPEAGPHAVPVKYLGWPDTSVAAAGSCSETVRRLCEGKADLAMSAGAFRFTAEGGTPPYEWAIAGDSRLERLSTPGVYGVTVEVADAAGHKARKELSYEVRERPNRWYEQARLVALIHRPESLKDADLPAFAKLMKRQGYGVGMMISYNNGDHLYRWPSLYAPNNPLGDVVAKYKAALEAEGIRFGMYLGNLDHEANGGENGAILVIDEVMRRYRPAALWFDWAGWTGVSLDAIYSVVRAHNPDTVIVLNGVPTVYNGDWDILCMEGWGAWGERHWDLLPFVIDWPKTGAMETWRLVADPAFEYSKGVQPDWREYLRLQIALIGMGFIANIDHSPTIESGLGPDRKLTSLKDSVIMQCHERMADWANPPGLPALHESYTRVDLSPLEPADWGYSVVNVARDVVYLHIMTNPLGKTGMPASRQVVLHLVKSPVSRATWMNRGRAVPWRQDGTRVSLDLSGVEADPIDTIVKLELAKPLPPWLRDWRRSGPSALEGNIAVGKPARLLSHDGQRDLPASAWHFAEYGNDGAGGTFAQGGDEWAWIYEVDLAIPWSLDRVVVHFGKGFATRYSVLVSEDRKAWRTLADVRDGKPGPRTFPCGVGTIRWIRVRADKPDGPGQEGIQMSIAELEAWTEPADTQPGSRK